MANPKGYIRDPDPPPDDVIVARQGPTMTDDATERDPGARIDPDRLQEIREDAEKVQRKSLCYDSTRLAGHIICELIPAIQGESHSDDAQQGDGPIDMDRVIEIARYNAANDVGVGPSYVSHLLAYIDDLEADATSQRERERGPDDV